MCGSTSQSTRIANLRDGLGMASVNTTLPIA
jgi:hypothetical protein